MELCSCSICGTHHDFDQRLFFCIECPGGLECVASDSEGRHVVCWTDDLEGVRVTCIGINGCELADCSARAFVFINKRRRDGDVSGSIIGWTDQKKCGGRDRLGNPIAEVPHVIELDG